MVCNQSAGGEAEAVVCLLVSNAKEENYEKQRLSVSEYGDI